MRINKELMERKALAIQRIISDSQHPLVFDKPNKTPFTFSTDRNNIYVNLKKIKEIAKNNPILAHHRFCCGMAHESGHHLKAITDFDIDISDGLFRLAVNLVDDYQINSIIPQRFLGIGKMYEYVNEKTWNNVKNFETYVTQHKKSKVKKSRVDYIIKMNLLASLLLYDKIKCKDIKAVKKRITPKTYNLIIKCMKRVKDGEYEFSNKMVIYNDVWEYLKKIFPQKERDEAKQSEADRQRKKGGGMGSGGKQDGDFDSNFDIIIFERIKESAYDSKAKSKGEQLIAVDKATKKEIEDMFNIKLKDVNEEKRIKERQKGLLKKYVNSDIIVPRPSDISKFNKIKRSVMPQINGLIRNMQLYKRRLESSFYYSDDGLALTSDFILRHISGENTLFKKDIVNRVDTKFSFILDVSGSVNLEKNQKIFVALSEMCKGIGLRDNDFGLYAFSDDIYVIKDFSEDYDNLVKKRIVSDEIVVSCTALCCATDVVIKRMANLSGENKVIIIVTDGYNNAHAERLSGFKGDSKAHLKEVISKSCRYGITLLMVREGDKSDKRHREHSGNLAYKDRVPHISIDELTELPQMFPKIFFKECYR